MSNHYIRFGEIPEDECSTEYEGSGDSQRPVKKLDGVSVYDCYIDNRRHDGPQVVIPPNATARTLDTLWGLLNYSDRPVYLVTGDRVGTGSDGEPLIKNVKIVSTLNLMKK